MTGLSHEVLGCFDLEIGIVRDALLSFPLVASLLHKSVSHPFLYLLLFIVFPIVADNGKIRRNQCEEWEENSNQVTVPKLEPVTEGWSVDPIVTGLSKDVFRYSMAVWTMQNLLFPQNGDVAEDGKEKNTYKR